MSALLAVSVLIAAQAKSSLPVPTAPPLASDPVISGLETKAGVHLDDYFPRRSYFGSSASGLKWSSNDRYLAYEWKAYGELQGADLYLYDAESGKSTRLTSPDTFRPFDRNIPKALDRYKKDAEEWTKVEAMNDLDYREWKLAKAEEAKKRKEPLASYAGPGEYVFAPDSSEILLTYGGDIYRWKLADKSPERLTQTSESEGSVKYTPDGKGFTFLRGGNLLRMRFDSPRVEQLNPALPENKPLTDYWISPDGTRLALESTRWTDSGRKINFVSYADRFARVETRDRGVADDDFKIDSSLYLYNLADNVDPSKDGKPWTLWKYEGGKSFQGVVVNERPWSPDSRRFVYGTFNGQTHDQELTVADLDKRDQKSIYKGKANGEHTTPTMANPFFTKDGNSVITLLDTSGYRHAWRIDLVNSTVDPITKGDFEAYPIRQTEDGSHLIVSANPEHPAKDYLYSVDLKSGEMAKLTRRDGTYQGFAVSDSGKRQAALYRNWEHPVELVALGGDEPVLTSSHNAVWAKVNQDLPQLFSYKNREGQSIYGFVTLPPGYKKTDRRPLFMYVYGGPLGTGNSVEVGVYNSTAYSFAQYLSRVFGYVTATIDPRGSTGYGNAFGRANYERPGQAQVEDLVDGVKYLQATYNTDPKKTGINGWSFGGFQTQMCMYTAPDVFTLGIAGAGPTQWQNYNTWYSNGVIGASPNAKPDDLDKYSLTYLAKNLRSPLMLLHGMVDDNVLFQDTVNVYRKLLQYGKGPIVELALDPTGNHGMGGDMDTRDRHAIYLSFLNRWWGPYTGNK